MNITKFFLCFFLILAFFAHAASDEDDENDESYYILDFSVYKVNISTGPFAKKLDLSAQQKKYSAKWKDVMQTALLQPVNFAGHYSFYISRYAEIPEECGDDRWVCGWIIDKTNGKVVSELPLFNENTKYFSTVDNGTPSIELFDTIFYPNSSMLWVRGQNIPAEGKSGDSRCANTIYNFDSGLFTKLTSGECELDTGSDEDGNHYLP